VSTTPDRSASVGAGRPSAQLITLRGAVFLGIGAMVGAIAGDNSATFWTKLFASALVLVTTFICIIGPGTVDRAQSVIVLALLVVFAGFVLVTLTHLDTHLLAPTGTRRQGPSCRAWLSPSSPISASR